MSRHKELGKIQEVELKIERELENLRQKPFNYTYCLTEGCPMASTCNHKVFFENDASDKKVITVFNPKMQEQDGNCCAEYVTQNETQVVARGFESFVSRLDDKTKKRFQRECIKVFCKSVYYEMRAGYRLLTPKEQFLITRCAQNVGIASTHKIFSHLYTVPKWS